VISDMEGVMAVEREAHTSDAVDVAADECCESITAITRSWYSERAFVFAGCVGRRTAEIVL
tara:strand:+ start:289 stop:471 length:183 start_codon:yes stop_codon:yes gene_type:complete